jgi:heptosyltransferase-3
MNILINRTDAIGDCLLSTPLARLLKARVKEDSGQEVQVSFLVSPRAGELIKLCEGVDQVFIYDPNWSFLKRWRFLSQVFKEVSPKSYFHLGGSFLPSFFAFLKKVPFRGGLRSKFFSFLFLNKGVRQSRSAVVMHESEYNMALAQPLNVHYSGHLRNSFRPILKVDSEKALEVRKTLGLDLKKKLFIFHPGMSGHTLNWSSRNYGRLIDRLYQKYGDIAQYVVSYTPSDGPYLEGLKDYLSQRPIIKEKVIFFDGSKEGLIHYTHLLKTCDLFVGPSTGTTHMANALDVPQVALYSPIKVQSTLRWGPYHLGDKVRVLVPDVVCGEVKRCAGASCPYYECMAKIEVAQAFDACVSVLEN